MAAKLGSLQIDISANVARIAKDMGKVTKTIDRSVSKIRKTVNIAKAAIVAMVGVEVARRAAALATEINAINDSYAKMAKQTGVAVEVLSAWNLGADLAGANSEILGKGLKTLAKNMNDAAMGTGEAMKAFKDLNINVKNADGSLRRTEDVLADMADRFSKMENGAKKSALAQLALGRAGQQLIPFLNQGSRGLREMTEEAKAFGVVVSGKVAKQSELFNDNIRRLSAIAEGVAQNRIKPITLAVNFLSDAFIKGYKSGGTLNAVLKTMKQTFKLLAGDVTAIENLAKQDSYTQLAIKIQATVVELNRLRREKKKTDELVADSKANNTYNVAIARQQVNLARAVGETQKYYKSLIRLRTEMKNIGQASKDIKKVTSPFEGLLDVPIKQHMTELAKRATIAYTDYFYDKGTGIFGQKFIAQGVGDFMKEIRKKANEAYGKSDLKAQEEEVTAFIKNMNENVKEFSQDYEDYMSSMQSFTNAWQGDFNEAIVNMTSTGKLRFKDMVNNILADMVRISSQKAFSPLLSQLFGSFFKTSAGAAPSKNTGKASGGIINQPTVMGGSWAGEKGPEAVMPLARIGGDLGVKSVPSSVMVQVIDQRQSGSRPEVEQTQGADGKTMIRVLIKDEVNRGLRAGEFDGSMSSTFGLSRKGMSR